MQWGLLPIQVADEGGNPPFVLEDLGLAGAIIAQDDTHPRVQKGELTQAIGKDVVVVFGDRKDFGTRLEMDLGACLVGITDDLHRGFRLSQTITLGMDMPVTVDCQLEVFRQRVDDGDADTVQATRYLVGVVVELPAGVEHRHDDFCRGYALLLMDIDRNASTVIGHADGIVIVDSYLNLAAIPGQGLVDGIVDDFEHHVVQAGAIIGVTDVHARPFAYGLKPLQDLDVRRIVCWLAIAHGVPLLACFT